MTSTRWPALTAVAVLLLTACSDDPTVDVPDPATEPTAEAPTTGPGEATDEPTDGPTSSVDIGGAEDIRSEVEIRVGEIISEYDGVETAEGTQLSVPTEVLFAFDEATLLPEAEGRLDAIVEVLDFYEDAPVEIVGHTDAQGDEAYNEDLSQRRAEAVATYLEQAGVDAGRFTVEGRGESEPVESNDTDAGRQANRRVEILVRGVAPPDVD